MLSGLKLLKLLVLVLLTAIAAAAQPKDSVVEKRRVDARTVLNFKLAPAGGSAIRLVPVR